ncbi:hypothetical protein DRN67_04400, partial [Candidatus Micrarchaeota archaeon]
MPKEAKMGAIAELEIIEQGMQRYGGVKEFVVVGRSAGMKTRASVLDPTWYNASWDYRKKITLKTSDINLSGDVASDHVVRIDQNSNDVGDFWAHVNSDGSDVRFVAADDSTPLDFYFQDWNYSEKRMVAWVKVEDTFTQASDVYIYLYYGSSSASDAQDVDAVLSGSYEAVYHYDFNGSYDHAKDELGDFNALADRFAWDFADKRAGLSAIDIDANSARSLRQATLLDTMPAGLAFELWFRPDSTIDSGLASNARLFARLGKASPEDLLSVYFLSGDGRVRAYAEAVGTVKQIESVTSSWSGGNWHHLLFSWDTSRGIQLFVNGKLEKDDATATTMMASDPGQSDFYMFADYDGTTKFDGVGDEFKVFKKGLSYDEVKIVYA